MDPQTYTSQLNQEPTRTDVGDEDPACTHSQPTIELLPEMSSWEKAIGQHQSILGGPTDARSELGLDTDRPIVMSGHQPIVFHSGILAKLIALDEAAKKYDAQPVWIVPDQDVVELGKIRLPVGEGASLSVETIDLLDEVAVRVGAASGSLPPQRIEHEGEGSISQLVDRLNQHLNQSSLAMQFAYTTIEQACAMLGMQMPTLIAASDLVNTQVLYELIDRMRQDPESCINAYNSAVSDYPDAKVRMLELSSQRRELPLWGCRVGQARVAIDTDNLDEFDFSELLPRGLLMSAIARSHLSDLFIHGKGGWAYDRVSEQWFKDWIGQQLSPMAMVTATLRLDLGFDDNELLDLDELHWQQHHSRHTPGMLGETELQATKDELVSQISSLPRKHPKRAELYRDLQRLLESFRESNSEQLAEIVDRINKALMLMRQRELASDRTWAFIHFSQSSLMQLDRATRSAMS